MKRIIFVRHAHRDTSRGRELDNGLSAKGLRQRQRLTEFLLRTCSGSLTIHSSLSKRCTETVAPLAEQLAVPLQVSDLLYERRPEESRAAFVKRVEQSVKQIFDSSEKLHVICSHGDWIPMAVWQLCRLEIPLKKGGLIELRRTESEMRLWMLLQSLKEI